MVPTTDPFSRSGALRIERQDFRRNKATVKAVSERIGADRRGHQPESIDLLAAMDGNRRQRQSA